MEDVKQINTKQTTDNLQPATETITLAHGSGGKLMHELIEKTISSQISNPILEQFGDSALINENGFKVAFTTDSFVVKPPFFNGGDIGKLAVCGTVNDLAVSGAKPLFLSLGLIIEEGFPKRSLEIIMKSISLEAKKADVKIVTGDTKVVEKGKGDGIFINTAGIGKINYLMEESISPGDKIIINGALAEHGTAIIMAREDLGLKSIVNSDCQSLIGLIDVITQVGGVKWMRDPTRGGLAATLNEASSQFKNAIVINEDRIPENRVAASVCEILGYDPLYMANEGKVVAFVSEDKAEEVLKAMKDHPLGEKSAIIGEITPGSNQVVLKTKIGGERIVDMPVADQLPRIC